MKWDSDSLWRDFVFDGIKTFDVHLGKRNIPFASGNRIAVGIVETEEEEEEEEVDDEFLTRGFFSSIIHGRHSDFIRCDSVTSHDIIF